MLGRQAPECPGLGDREHVEVAVRSQPAEDGGTVQVGAHEVGVGQVPHRLEDRGDLLARRLVEREILRE